MAIIDNLAQLIFNVYEAFTVAFYVRDHDQLNCVASATFAKSFSQHKSIPVEGTLPGWVIKHGTPLVIPNFDRDESALGYYGTNEGIKSFMGYPMETDGVIIVDSKRKYVFTEKEKKILGSFASMIHEELGRERKTLDQESVFEELHVENRILGLFSALNQSKISVMDVLHEMLHVSGGDLCFIGMEKKGRLFIQDAAGPGDCEEIKKACQPGESIAAMVMAGSREMLLPHNSGYLREKPLFFQGEPLKARQFFGFPLVSDDVAFGVIGFVAFYESHLRENSIATLRHLSSLMSLYYTSLWMKQHVERLKDFDPLTGAIAFPSFLSLTERMVRNKNRFSLVSVKLLNTHSYNKKNGADFTNELLRKIFQVMKYCAGSQSYVTRKNGGHFYIAVKGSETFETRNMLKLLQHAISKSLSEERLSDTTNLIEITLASFPEDSQDLWGLFEKNETKRMRKITD